MAGSNKTSSAPLRLLADDAEDLQVLSAALQDGVCTIGDISFEPAAKRLTLAINRFRWEASNAKRGGERVRAALQLGGVLQVKARRLRRDAPQAVLSLLSIGFDPGEPPEGVVRLNFAGGGELKVDVECIDAVLNDLSAPWSTPRRPAHDLAEN